MTLAAVPQRDSTSFDYFRAFSRNIGLVSAAEQARLRRVKVAIPGCGGVGGLHGVTLARMGVGRFALADFDRFELENMNRQSGARVSTLGASKVEIIKRDILDINPTAEIEVFDAGVDASNVETFLRDVDVVTDGLDFFAFEARDRLFATARRLRIPLVTGAPLGFSCALLYFAPDGMSYEDYFGFKDDDPPARRALKLAMGVAPRATHLSYMNLANVDLRDGKGPSSAIGVDLCAAAVAAETLKLVLGRGRIRPAPAFTQYDVFTMTVRRGRLWFGHRNPWHRCKLWFVGRLFAKRRRTS